VIQLDKIQQVNLTQSLLQRIISVYAIDVDTAGSTQKEGKIKAVSHELALSLKERLLNNDRVLYSSYSPSETSENVATEEKPFIKIGLLSLLKVGITSNYIKSFWLLVVFFASIYENLRHLGSGVSYAEDKMNTIQQMVVVQSIGVIALAFFALILFINVIRVVVRYFNYNIAQQSGSLLISYGLINTKSTIIKPEKVQITSITQNYFQKKMNVTELRISQAASGEKQEKNASIEIPGCDNNERNAILKLLFREMPEKGYMIKPNWRKLVFSLFLIIVLPLSVFYLSGGQNIPQISNYPGLIPASSIFAAALIYFGFRNYRLFINDRFIIKQSGAWDVSNDIIEPGKIQAITTSQLFWHKNLNIGSLTIHTAGGNLTFNLGNFDRIKEYVNLWLYEIETSDSNWM
jgi:putative membrane protein